MVNRNKLEKKKKPTTVESLTVPYVSHLAIISSTRGTSSGSSTRKVGIYQHSNCLMTTNIPVLERTEGPPR